MNHPEEFTKTTPNHIVKWVLKERQQLTTSAQQKELEKSIYHFVPAFTLGTLTRGHGGFLQVIIVPLHGRVRGLEGLLRRGLIRHPLLQL